MISKSCYCGGVQCPRMMWLKKNRPELFDEAVMNKAILEAGNKVGDLAMGMFGDFVEVPFMPEKFGYMLGYTKKLIAENTPVICEASFSKDGLFCMVDILKNLGNGDVEMYEVKSSTSMKDIYFEDAAFQRYLLTIAGYNVKKVCVVHINNKYERHGDLDLSALFTMVDITERAEKAHGRVAANVDKFKKVLKQTEEPSRGIGEHCFLPYACGFWKHCSCNLPTPNVFDVAGMKATTKCEKYRNGIITFADLHADDTLTKNQKIQVDTELLGTPRIDKNKIKDFLATLPKDLYFLDFETMASAIPLYDGTRPFQQLPFQYSLHILKGGKLEHKEFLAEAGQDPRRTLAERLCEDIPKNACAVAYNMRFEKSIISSLAKLFPDLHDHLMNIYDGMKDVMKPFADHSFYLKEMQGSYSIKYVLPALYPNEPSLNYGTLEGVHNGGDASAAFVNMAEMDAEEVERTRKNLLKYCELDTFAMVKVLEKLKEVAEN